MTSKFLHSMNDKFKTIIRYSFCDIENNQGLVKVYQPQPSAQAENPLFNLVFTGYHKIKTKSNIGYSISLRFPSGDKTCTVDTAFNYHLKKVIVQLNKNIDDVFYFINRYNRKVLLKTKHVSDETSSTISCTNMRKINITM